MWLRSKFNRAYRKASYHLRNGEALIEANQFRKATEEIEKSIKILEDSQKLKLLNQAYLYMGDLSMKNDDWESAVNHYVLAQETGTKIRDGVSEDILYLKLGSAYRQGNRKDDAFRCIDRAREIQEKINEHPMLAETFTRLAEVEMERGHFEVAIEHYLRALSFQERIRDKRAQAASRTALGELHSKKDNKSEAINHYQLAIQLYREVGNQSVAIMLDDKIKELSLV